MRLVSSLLRPMILASVALVPTTAGAEYIYGYGDLGKFEGELTYAAADAHNATLTVTLTNVSPEANGGYLTAFALNNPRNFITGASLTASDTDFMLLGGPGFNNDINAAPFGQFDLGAGLDTNYNGGGTPSLGIAVGGTETFVFHLTGDNLTLLNDEMFHATLAHGSPGPHWMVTRFRGFNDGDSDKVPAVFCRPDPGIPEDPGGGVSDSPEPGTLVLAGIGIAGFVGFGARRRK